MTFVSRVLAGVAVSSLLAGAAMAGPVVKVAQGQLEGAPLAKADAFMGVPFAAPPVGDLRWKAPQAAKAWTGVRPATKASASCYQVLNPPEGRDPWTPEYLISPAISEDCLYLNVWAPKGAAGKKLPVFFWIHGGGFTEGSGEIPIYDGANLASNNVIVVTVNYRVDAFGFLANPELVSEAGTAGNYGLLDLVEALKWTKANIAAFGGDPNAVTIAGQSAGAGAVHDLIGMPSAKGLFVRAIAQSGSGISPRATAMQSGFAAGEAFAKVSGAATLADQRKLSSQAVLDAAVKTRQTTPGAGFRALIDGKVIPKDPTLVQTVAGSDFNDTPIMTGYNADEGSGFETAYGSWPVAEIDKRIAAFGPVADRAKAIYAANGVTDPAAVGKTLSRDRGMAFTHAWAKKRAGVSKNPIYVYQFNHDMPGPKSARYGAFHTAEVPFVFQNLIGKDRTYTADDRKVAATVSGYWLNFIKTGNPNGAGLPNWPAYSQTNYPVARLDTTVLITPVLPPAKLSLYEDFVGGNGQLSSR